jgi:hypothetical protein
MSFEKDKYEVVKRAIPKDVASFCYAYFLNKRQVAKHLQDTQYISPFDDSWGTWKDEQIPDTYSHYADLVMETLMVRVRPKMMAVTKMNLVPTYTYARIYKYGDILHRHKDRKVILKPGDMLVYSGCDLEHWRDAFEGQDCGQVFLHYNNKQGQFEESNAFDGRPMLGLPAYYKKAR